MRLGLDEFAADVRPAVRQREARAGPRECSIGAVAVGDHDAAVAVEHLARGLMGATFEDGVRDRVLAGEAPCPPPYPPGRPATATTFYRPRRAPSARTVGARRTSAAAPSPAHQVGHTGSATRLRLDTVRRTNVVAGVCAATCRQGRLYGSAILRRRGSCRRTLAT
jgi:hypothetical protein